MFFTRYEAIRTLKNACRSFEANLQELDKNDVDFVELIEDELEHFNSKVARVLSKVNKEREK